MKLDGEMPKREVLISKLAKKLAKEGSASLDYKESQDYKRAEGPSRDEHRHQLFPAEARPLGTADARILRVPLLCDCSLPAETTN